MKKDARAARLVATARRLRAATAKLSFAAPVTHVYRPLEYAWDAHRCYLERYGGRGASVLLVGMNPGPFGMAQTGVPFGDVGCVRDWLGIECPVGRPDDEHPRRKIEGFDCPRGEVSGRRLWGWARDSYGTPAQFFARFFVWNFCPLAFMEDSGRNRTPDKLPAAERAALYAPCERALSDVIECLAPTHVVGIGRFAYDRAAALGDIGVAYVYAPHPSPASPAANRGWAGQFVAALDAAAALG
jgi:single-strand selective monofunctional uracil DNA glycosylase